MKRQVLFAACVLSYAVARWLPGDGLPSSFLGVGELERSTEDPPQHRPILEAPEPVDGEGATPAMEVSHARAHESAAEQLEERQMASESQRLEAQAINGALGAPHEGEGLESDVPHTIAEDSIEANNALRSLRGLATGVVMPASGIFLLCIMLGNGLSISKYLSWVPESAMTLAVSVLLGLLVRHFLNSGVLSLETFTFVNATVLNLGLLPIIIFNSGWALRKGDFWSQLEYILVFAILGTLISTFLIAYSCYHLTSLFTSITTLTLRESFAFAALISAVDPVATLSTYAELNIPTTQPLLNIMVFGESTINDAVAIVLFELFNRDWFELSHLQATLDVCRLLFGSMFFGMIVAAALILVMRCARLPGHTAAEILYIWTCSYFVFASAEAAHFSGIIAALFAGMIFEVYGRPHLTEEAQYMAREYLALSAQTADNAVFILCGASTALITSTQGLVFGLYGVVLCLAARGASVSACAAVSNSMKVVQGDPHILTWRHQVMMWHGGLRGGIALVLALQLDQRWCGHKAMLINATFVIISMLLLLLGSTTELLIDKLQFPPQEDISDSALIVDKRWYMRFFNSTDDWIRWALVGPPKPKPREGTEGKLKANLVPEVVDGFMIDVDEEQASPKRQHVSPRG